MPAAGRDRLPVPALPQGAGRPRCPRSITSSAPTRSALIAEAIAGRIERRRGRRRRRAYLYDDSAPRRPFDGAAHRLREDRRGLRSPVRVLHHPQAARPAAQPHAGIGGARGARRWPRAAPGDLPGRPGPDHLRHRPAEGTRRSRRARRAGVAAGASSPRSRACAGSACTTPIRPRAPTSCWTSSRASRASRSTSTCRPARRQRRAQVDAPRVRRDAGARSGRARPRDASRAARCARRSSSATRARPTRPSSGCATSCARPSWIAWACSTISREEGTVAALLPKRVPQKEIDARRRELLRIQREVSKKKLRRDARPRAARCWSRARRTRANTCLMGRHEGQAPEIDGQVYLSLPPDAAAARARHAGRRAASPTPPNTTWPPSWSPDCRRGGAPLAPG